MAESKNLARVILRSDGSVHIAFYDIRSIYATAENIMKFFSVPIEFIESESQKYEDSTHLINRKRVDLDNVLGLTLASVNSDKQIVCDFPELFQYIMQNSDEKAAKKHLDMQDFEHKRILSDEKAFLLRYYLEFTRNLQTSLVIKKQIKLRDEVQFAIIREILNAYFTEELSQTKPIADLSQQIIQTQNQKMYSPDPEEPEGEWVTANEYAIMLDVTTQTVLRYIKEGRIKSFTREENGRYRINKNVKPLDWDMRKGRKRKKNGEDKFYKRPAKGSAADVLETIRKNKHFTEAIAPYIRTYDELDYYVKKNYYEVCFSGRPALIIDVNPDYIVPDNKVPQKVRDKYKSEPNKTFRNRDLMKEGFSPVVPHKAKDEYNFDIHHIGGRFTSPFCTIPSFEHNSKELSSVFHQGTPEPNLHSSEFELQKKVFWKNYIEEYDKAGKFTAIPRLNSKKR